MEKSKRCRKAVMQSFVGFCQLIVRRLTMSRKWLSNNTKGNKLARSSEFAPRLEFEVHPKSNKLLVSVAGTYVIRRLADRLL